MAQIIKEMGKPLIVQAIVNMPVTIMACLSGVKLILPYYHMVSDETVSHVRQLYSYKTVRQFKEDLEYLTRYYAPTSLPEILDHLKKGMKFRERTFLLTFDDGFREMSDIVAPILLAKGISATFFVNSAFVDNRAMCYLNKVSLLVERFKENKSPRMETKIWEILKSRRVRCDDVMSGIRSIGYNQDVLLQEIATVVGVDFEEYLMREKPYLTSPQINKLVQEGFTIGAHSIDHPLYSTLSLAEQLRQTVKSVEFVRRKFKLDYGVFAFPHNDDGVRREFFYRLTGCGLVDASFGTSGLIEEHLKNHMQRFSLENPSCTAKSVINFQYARRLRKMVTGSHINIRGN